MGTRAGKKAKPETARAGETPARPEDGPVVGGTGGAPATPDTQAPSNGPDDMPGVAWGPGKNFYGWAMTIVLLALLAGIAFAGFRLFGETFEEAESSGTVEERKNLERQTTGLGSDLCEASLQAATAPRASIDIFQQKVHGPLHALADALADEDRPLAAKLLRDKFNVEQDIGRMAPAPELAVSLAALNETAMDGLRILSLPSPACLPPAAPAAPAPGGPPPPPAP